MSPRLFEALYGSTLAMNAEPTTARLQDMIQIFIRNRPWFHETASHYNLLPAFRALCQSSLHTYITDWREMLLEWPHQSEEDVSKVAYTQSEDKGKRGLYTRTSMGKYIKRHCPTMPDHVLRDFVALHDPSHGKCKFVHTVGEMIEAVEEGPKSCMQFGGDYDGGDHPYSVYDPQYGWHMAVRVSSDDIHARCLCNGNVFVRSYTKCPNGGFSHSDTALEAWLQDQGYEKVSRWPEGLKLRCIDAGYDRYVMPYIDGELRDVELYDDVFVLDSNGDFCADNTDGYLGDTGVECDSCGDSTHEDELHSVGFYGDQRVCNHCLENDYTYAIGRGGDEYYALNHECTYVEEYDEWYEDYYMSDNGIVECRDEYNRFTYRKDDDCWYCEGSGEYYTNDVPSYYDDWSGCTYHEDSIPEGLMIDENGTTLIATPEVETQHA